MIASLESLAEAAGVQVHWDDAAGTPRKVAPEALEAVLSGLGLPAETRTQRTAAIELLRDEAERLRPLYTAAPGASLTLPISAGGNTVLHLETGESRRLTLAQGPGGATLTAPREIGYHRLEAAGASCILAVCPDRAYTPQDAAPQERLWGLAVQIYALRETPGRAFGDFGDLAASARSAAAAGADALAVSPAHALFLADPDRYSPYAPSTRLWLNGLFGDLRRIGAASAPSDGAAFELIDWSAAWPRRREALRAGFLGFRERSGPEVDRLNAFRSEGGRRLLDHARFEALHARFLGSGQGHWRGWPKEFQDPNSQAVQAFAREQASEVDFHIFLQWLADESLREAQSAARSAGMRIGLIADLAVGTDPGGSHAWSRRDEILEALSIGAPPDLFQAEGQDWGVAGIAPRALLAGGYAAFLETVRAALRNAGGVRIDHAMGLRRLWMVPRGAAAKDGAYVAYPFADLLRLLSLESRRAQAIVSAEDLGTVPPGFREALAEAGVLGMNVLWFQTSDQGFLPPSAWTSDALALTSTHDLPTVAGWWGGRDLAWREALGREPDPSAAGEQRRVDREALWSAFVKADAAEGPAPPPGDGGRASTAALGFIAKTPSPLAIAPVEDLLGAVEQINLPGVVDGHPNWRRRLSGPLAGLLAAEAPAARIKTLNARKDP